LVSFVFPACFFTVSLVSLLSTLALVCLLDVQLTKINRISVHDISTSYTAHYFQHFPSRFLPWCN
jgi:hypothetical protein